MSDIAAANSAQTWKLRFQQAIERNEDPSELNQQLVQGILDRTWAQFVGPNGEKFRSFRDFCEAPQPLGLNTAWQQVNDFLCRLVGPRMAGRLTVAPPRQGTRNDRLPDPEGKKLTRHESRKNRINEGPEVIRRLYDAGYLTAKEAERAGKKKKDETVKVALDEFCEKYTWAVDGSRPLDDAGLAELKRDYSYIFPQPLYSVIEDGENSEALSRILEHCAPQDAVIADLTYGRGAFWRRIDLNRYELRKSDLAYTGTDSRNTDYRDREVNVVVFDPPYLHAPGGSSELAQNLENSYRTHVRQEHGYKPLVQLYEDTAREAARILSPRGMLVIKCMDQVASGKNRWLAFDLKESLESLGFEAREHFIVLRTDRPALNENAKVQTHARKVHSFFLTFRLADPSRRKNVELRLLVSREFQGRLRRMALRNELTPAQFLETTFGEVLVEQLDEDAFSPLDDSVPLSSDVGPGIKKASALSDHLKERGQGHGRE